MSDVQRSIMSVPSPILAGVEAPQGWNREEAIFSKAVVFLPPLINSYQDMVDLLTLVLMRRGVRGRSGGLKTVDEVVGTIIRIRCFLEW